MVETANPLGRLRDYNVSRPSDDAPDSNAVYLVLRLDGLDEDDEHTLACRAAARAYVKFAREHPFKLAETGEALESLLDQLDGIVCRILAPVPGRDVPGYGAQEGTWQQ